MSVYLAIYTRLRGHLVLSAKGIARLRIKRAAGAQAGGGQLPPTANSNAPARHAGVRRGTVLQKQIGTKTHAFGYGSRCFRDSLQPASSLATRFYAEPRIRSVQREYRHFKTSYFAKFKYMHVVICYFQ